MIITICLCDEKLKKKVYTSINNDIQFKRSKKLKVKVKQSHYRPGKAHRVPGG
jgi:hypothetical protein